MPVIHSKEYSHLKIKRKDPPSDLKPNEKLFVVRFTNELFRSYNNYSNRIDLYRKRIWACKYTGKVNLTFEEALESENEALAADVMFPEKYILSIINVVHQSTDGMGKLIPKVIEYLEKYPVLDENVNFTDKKEIIHSAVIKEIIYDENNKVIKRYIVEYNGENNENIRKRVKPKRVKRKGKLPFTQQQVKLKIKQLTNREDFNNAPWIVKEEMLRKYGLSTELSDDTKRIILIGQDRMNKRSRHQEEDREPNGQVALDRDGEGDERPAKTVRRANVFPVDDLLLVDPHFSLSFTGGGGGTGEEIAKHVPEGMGGGRHRKDQSALADSRYPVPRGTFDLTSPHAAPVLPVEDPPAPDSKSSVVDPEDHAVNGNFPVGMALRVFCFLHDFSRSLGLYPFSFEDFMNALNFKEISLNLLVEIHCRLLKALKQKASPSTWESTLKNYLKKSKKLQNLFSKYHYPKMPLEDKLKILSFLINDLENSEKIRKVIDDSFNTLTELQREEREKKQEVKHKLNESATNNENKETEDLEKKLQTQISQVETKYDKELQKFKVRTKPLGSDRFYRRYWSIPTLEHLLVLEIPPKSPEYPAIVDKNLDLTPFGPHDYPDQPIYRYYTTIEEVDRLIEWLDNRGIREKLLKKTLQKKYELIKTSMQIALKELAREEQEARRSTRIKSRVQDHDTRSFVVYENHWA